MRVGPYEVLFFDIGCTLVNEDAAMARQCADQADTDEARRLGLTPELLMEEIRQATLDYRPQYRTVLQKYGLTRATPYPHGLEVLYDGAGEVLAALSQRYRLGVIANQGAGLTERLRGWGIAEYFDPIVSSWEVGVMKPDPGIFRIALERAGVSPERCLMIGDRLDNDIFPAKSLGMGTVWIRQGFGGQQSPKSEAYAPDARVESLRELLRIL